jgi:hypothetical protein
VSGPSGAATNFVCQDRHLESKIKWLKINGRSSRVDPRPPALKCARLSTTIHTQLPRSEPPRDLRIFVNLRDIAIKHSIKPISVNRLRLA